MQDVKQHYSGLAPAVARFSPSPQGRYVRPAPHLQSDLLSRPEDPVSLSSHSILSTPVADTPHSDTPHSNMPSLVAQSDDDSDSDSDPGSEADTDPGDDESDADGIPDDPTPMPPLAELSDDDSDNEADIDDDATDTMSVGSVDLDDLHPLSRDIIYQAT